MKNIAIKLTMCAAVICFGPMSVQAMPMGHSSNAISIVQADQAAPILLAKSQVVKTKKKAATRNKNGQRRNGQAFRTPVVGPKDTCNSSDPFYGGDCSPDALAERCEGAWGMSSEPGGGVSCEPAE